MNKMILLTVLLAAPAGAQAAATCSVQVDDASNHTSEPFFVEKHYSVGNSSVYVVTEGLAKDGKAPESERTVVSGPKTPIEADSGVPHPSPDEILSAYGKAADAVLSAQGAQADVGQLKLRVMTGARCDRFEVSLLLFWINEWFYFG